jgi:hypothetical protein
VTVAVVVLWVVVLIGPVLFVPLGIYAATHRNSLFGVSNFNSSETFSVKELLCLLVWTCIPLVNLYLAVEVFMELSVVKRILNSQIKDLSITEKEDNL